MFLTEKPNYPSFFDSFNNQKKKKKEFDLISQSFDESILRRLNNLCNSRSSVTINFSWLSSALAFLSFTHNQAITLLSNPKLTDSLNFYLDDSLKLLDICNSIASEIERLRHRRLLLKLALHLFNNNNNSEDAEKLRRARASLTDWDNNLKGPRYESSKNLEHLVIDLAFMLKEVPRGKISSDERIVRRTIHSVGLVTVFVAGVVVAALRGSTELGVAVRAPSEFLWADSFNILNSAISAESGKKRHLLEELDDVEARLREVIGVMDDAGGEKGESLNGAVKELERVTETLGEGLERLSNGVNEVFNTVMSSRKEMLERMRAGQQKQQTK
ncbi:hypothetical protein NC652_020868 [Populus alba x Populus x berolinensis]|nr:hypothetical protein NC652_020868 [Populus alba x Populus x berolinensis]